MVALHNIKAGTAWEMCLILLKIFLSKRFETILRPLMLKDPKMELEPT